MKIQNLCEHQTNGVVDYYSADLVEEGKTIPVRFSKSVNGMWIAYNLKTGLIYPIESVGDNKLDVTSWNNGDEILLGNVIPKNN